MGRSTEQDQKQDSRAELMRRWIALLLAWVAVIVFGTVAAMDAFDIGDGLPRALLSLIGSVIAAVGLYQTARVALAVLR